MKIGVFDSGVGGLSVVNAIKAQLPQLEIIYKEDRANVPYGTKTPEQLRELVVPILQSMVKERCQAIVIACNTVTTTIIEDLRSSINVPLIGMEPMVKPAAMQTKSKIIAVCATPTTLKSKRYKYLKSKFAAGVAVLEPDCSDWALMIESKQVDRTKVRRRIDEICDQGADVIVLGCTHYHWIEDIIHEEARGRAIILQPEQPVFAQLRRVLEQLG